MARQPGRHHRTPVLGLEPSLTEPAPAVRRLWRVANPEPPVCEHRQLAWMLEVGARAATALAALGAGIAATDAALAAGRSR